MLLFDAHSHLADAAPPLRPGQGPEQRLGEPGHPRVVCGTCEADWEAVLAHAHTDDRVIPMLGLHPWFVAEASPQWLSRLEALLRLHPAGVGECGLDFARRNDEAHRCSQEAAFRAQLRLARDLQRPVAMHVVRAWGPLLVILREEGVPQAGAMVHAYGGSPEVAAALQGLGVFLSFSGDLLNPARLKLQESVRSVAADHLLLETDGTADLPAVVEAAARLRGEPSGDLAARTWENGHRCFKELMA
jgi:TatD DNase family protein